MNSTYKSFWKGITAGVDIGKNIGNFNVKTRTQYHQVGYKGYADWNLIDEFAHPISFKHLAKGFVVSQNVVLSYKMSKYIHLFLNAEYGY